jgi:hypothetical protein
VGIMPVENPHRDEPFLQTRVGLHHFCLRA